MVQGWNTNRNPDEIDILVSACICLKEQAIQVLNQMKKKDKMKKVEFERVKSTTSGYGVLRVENMNLRVWRYRKHFLDF